MMGKMFIFEKFKFIFGVKCIVEDYYVMCGDLLVCDGDLVIINFDLNFFKGFCQFLGVKFIYINEVYVMVWKGCL